jgi:SpoVK/Ycf46/Vps4 family AAA+-type ATPase
MATVARSDLLVNLVKASVGGEKELFDQTLAAIIAEERSKQHHVLADTLSRTAHKGLVPLNGHKTTNNLNAELVFQRQPEVDLSSLVLSAEVRTTLAQFIEEQQRADLLRSYNLEPRSRLLFTGPPGNGKTSLAEAIAASLSSPFFVVRYDSLIASYLGETAQRLRELFQYARQHRCVLFFDEFDAVGKERGDIHETGEIKRVVNSLLLEIDSLPSYVVLIAASNHSELLDRAAWRTTRLAVAGH